MCGIAEAGIAMSVLSGVVTAVGQFQAGQSAKAEADYRAQIQRNNALRADQLSEDALERGKQAESQERLRGRLLIGQMRAVLAGSGQVVDEGSAGDLVIDQVGVSELDALNVRSNAAREAAGFRAEAAQFQSEASLTQIAGASAARGAKFQAAGTLLGTGGKVASKWYDYKKSGAFG